MANYFKVKKGIDIPLEGNAKGKPVESAEISLFAVSPSDFPGFTWKVCVKPDEEVLIGSPLMKAKENESLALVSPVAGKVKEISRGERRKIRFVSVEKSSSTDYCRFELNLSSSREELVETLCKCGLFAWLRQRPFDIVPDPAVVPRDIFVTGFDSAPLAPDYMDGFSAEELEAGLRVMAKLTDGKVYLSTRAGSGISSSAAEVFEVEGPHPAGNVGVQIANIKPVNKGETVWTANAGAIARIGRLMLSSKIDYSVVASITGPLSIPRRVATFAGASLKNLLSGDIEKSKDEHIRIISGNVLTGIRENIDGFLHFPYSQVTIIREGDNVDEFMGWASMNPEKFSVKHTFPAFLRGLSKPFDFDARIKGGRRAMILSGEYDKVFPMDIYPEYLIKAIMAKDIDKMEKLGIYEVAPEDFALPEFVDTSKLELQKIVRDGLDYLRKETL